MWFLIWLSVLACLAHLTGYNSIVPALWATWGPE